MKTSPEPHVLQNPGEKKPDPQAGLTNAHGVSARGDHRYNSNSSNHLLTGGTNECPINPIVQILTANFSACELLDLWALLRGDRAFSGKPLVDQTLRHTELFGECRLADLVL